jgi:hypothetical protein
MQMSRDLSFSLFAAAAHLAKDTTMNLLAIESELREMGQDLFAFVLLHAAVAFLTSSVSSQV